MGAPITRKRQERRGTVTGGRAGGITGVKAGGCKTTPPYAYVVRVSASGCLAGACVAGWGLVVVVVVVVVVVEIVVVVVVAVLLVVVVVVVVAVLLVVLLPFSRVLEGRLPLLGVRDLALEGYHLAVQVLQEG